MLAILATAVLIVAASFAAGRAFLFALGRRRPTWLSGAVGFALLTVASPLLIRLPGRATTSAIAITLALILCLAAMRRRFFAEKPTTTTNNRAMTEAPQAGAADQDEHGGTAGPTAMPAGGGEPAGEHGGTAEPAAQYGSSETGGSPPPADSETPPIRAPRAAHQAALATVLITLALACLPFLLNQSTGVLGEGIYTNDQAAQLYWTDWLQHGVGPEPSAVRFGYPTGPQSLTASVAQLTGASLEHAFDGLLVAIPVLAALAALSALGGLSPRRRVGAAVIAGLPYLGASFLAQSAFKETAMGLLVLGLAVALGERDRQQIPRRAMLGAVVVLAAASVFTYSLPGLAWFAGALGIWAALMLVREGRGLVANLSEWLAALRRHRGLVALAIVVVAVVAVLGAGAASNFAGKIGKVQSSAGRLGSPISPGEVLAVWPKGDFRVVRGDVAAAIPAAALGFLAVALGALFAYRRREHGLLAVLAAGFLIYVAARVHASIYVQAKALAVVAPVVAFTALRGLLSRDFSRSRGRIFTVLGALFATGALLSTLLALRTAPVGFDERASQLESLGSAIQGKSVAFLGLDRFAAYWLRGTLVQAPGGYVPPEVRARADKPWLQGQPVDFDTMSPGRLDGFQYAVTTAAAFQSSPPPNFRMVGRHGDYELWKRHGKTPPQRVLPEGVAAGVLVDCNTPAGSDLHVQSGTATVLPRPVVGAPDQWSQAPPFYAPGSASARLDLTPGRWSISLQYNSQAPLRVDALGSSVDLPASLDGMYFSHPGQGAFWPAGEIDVRRGGPVKVTVRAAEPSALRRLAGVRRNVWLGYVAASPAGGPSQVPLSRACGRYVDHYRLSGYPR